MTYTVVSQNNTVTKLQDDQGNVIHIPAFASLSTQEYTIKKVNNSIATLEDANGKTLRNVPCVVVLVDDSSKYNVTAQNNTSVTLEDENNKVIHAPAKVVLATSTDFTLVKVNNSTATLQDGSGNIIRNVPCVSMLADKNFTLSKVNNSTAVLTDDNSQTIRDVPCIVVLAKQSGAITVIVGPAPAPLSLPDAIVDSLQYVKAYGGTYQGVPDGYTMLDSVSNRTQTTCDVNTGVYVDVDDVEIEIQVDAKTGSWYIFQSQKSQNANIWGISGATSGAKISFNWGGEILQSNITRTSGNTYYIKATAKNGNATLYVKDITNNVEDTVTDTYVYGSGPTSWFGIFGTERNPSLTAGNAVYFAKMSVGGKQVLDAIPAQRQSDNVNGFYNKINGQFLIPEELTALNAGTPVVPTPTAPIDITCNNGVLKYSKNLLDMSEENIVLGKYINNNGVIIDSSFNFYNSKYIPVVAGETYTWSTSSSVNYFSVMEYDSAYVFKKRTLFGTSSSSPAGTSGTITLRSDTAFVLLGSNIDGNNVTLGKITAVDWQFEKGSYATAYAPYVEGGIYTDGTVETINVHGKNLFDGGIYARGQWSNTGEWSTSYADKRIVGSLTPITPNTTYTMKINNTSDNVAFWNYAYFDANRNWLGNRTINGESQSFSGATEKTFTITDANARYFAPIVAIGNEGTATITDAMFRNAQIKIEQGETATAYEPYYDGGTAMAEMLLKVGDYQDKQEILSGAVTRNVGVKVLDGTENFETATATNCYSLTNTLGTGNFADRTIVCSHFANTPTMPGTGDRQGLAFIVNKGPEYTIAFGATTQFSTQALWKQWLADQYAAGTPVTVIYPLAQAVTEQVAPQVLNVQTGDNILEITQASLSNLELEAEYTKQE